MWNKQAISAEMCQNPPGDLHAFTTACKATLGPRSTKNGAFAPNVSRPKASSEDFSKTTKRKEDKRCAGNLIGIQFEMTITI